MNTLMRKTVIGSALLLMVSTSQAADVANAQPQPLNRPGALFSQADVDQDGKLSADEFAQLQKLHEAEMAKRQAARPGFTTLDQDGDGYVTQEEMRAAMK
nr:EF-hand domain-containing protein [Aeromonadaceae bacterium]